MEQFLLNSLQDATEEISFLGFLTTIKKEIISYDDIEKASKILYNMLFNFYNHNEDDVINTLKSFLTDIEAHNYVLFHNYKFFIHDKWLLNTVVISSIRNIKILFKNISRYKPFLENLLKYILDNIQIIEFKTAHLLRILELVVRKMTFEVDNCLRILYSMQNVALSPFTNLKYYAQNISKNIFSKHDLQFLVTPQIIDLIPIKGIDTSTLVKFFNKSFILQNLHLLLEKINSLFCNNTENRDAGFIYDQMLNLLDFNDWKCLVWNFFYKKFVYLEYEGEYYQSLLKYWIPISVKHFRAELYSFIETEEVNLQFKGQVLLELKRKSFSTISLNINYLNNMETRNLGLKLLSTFSKKSLCITSNELNTFIQFLYSLSSTEINGEILLCFRDFFTHFFISGHLIVLNLTKNSEKENVLSQYISFFVVLSNFCYNNLNKDRCELSAQILSLILEISNARSSKLRLLYTLEKGETFEEKGNLFVVELLSTRIWKLNSSNFCQKIELCYRETNGYCPNLSKLIGDYYIERFKIFTVENLYSLFEFNEVCLQNDDKVKNFTYLLMKRLNLSEKYNFLVGVTSQLRNAIKCTINDKNEVEMIENEQQMFKIVLYLEILLIGINSVQINLMDCVFDVFNYISCFIDRSTQERSLKNTKTMEAILNNSLQLILQIKCENLENCITYVTKIILKSDMRRPTTLAVDVLKHLLMSRSLNDQINFLDNALKKIHVTSDKQLLKIRRNPESRLLIYAICSADKSTEKVLLKWTIHYLLNILKNDQSENSSVAAALHTLELLISETNLHNSTLEFIPAIIEGSVEVFNRANWTVRNADLQLTKAIIERFLGVSLTCTLNDRPKSVEDLFLLFPNISFYFYNILSSPLSDKSIIIFQYFSESQHRCKLIENKNLSFIRNSFIELFVDIVKNYSEFYGNHALNAFVSLCNHDEIFNIFEDIVKYTIENNLSKNDLKNMLKILHELYLKSNIKTKFELNKKIKKLVNNLRKQSEFHLDLLLVKILTNSEICEMFQNLNKTSISQGNVSIVLNKNYLYNNFRYRIWLHNYIPYLISTSKLMKICKYLAIIYSENLPQFIQIKVLTILIFRFHRGDFKNNELVCIRIVETLINFVINSISHLNNYLIECYFNVILTFFESINDSLAIQIQLNPINPESIGTNIHKMFLVLIFCPASCNLRTLITQMIELINSDTESVDSFLCMLKYIFNRLENESFDKKTYFNFFTLVFYLFLKYKHYDLIHFVNSIFKTKHTTTLEAISCLMNFKNLLMLLKGDKALIAKYLLDMYFHVKSLSSDFQETGTFYLSKIDLPIAKNLLLKNLEKSLIDCYKSIN